MSEKLLNYAFVLLVGMLFATIFLLVQRPWQVGASVTVGNQYQSTTTPTVADQTNLCPKFGSNPNNVGSSTTGILGSVNVQLTGTGNLSIYDATTSDVTLRAPAATSSLLLADFPISPTAGSYHYDIEFKRGLLIDYNNTGTGVASTTISYRCEG